MTAQQIQSAQDLGRTYAADNHQYIFEDDMNADGFSAAALANYNANADGFNEPPLPNEIEVDFLFGAKNFFIFTYVD